jgi:hypothetical protein
LGQAPKAYRAAELDDRIVHVEQLSDAELMRIAMGSQQTDVTSAPQSPKLRSKCCDGCSDSDVVANRAFPVLRPRINLALHFEPIANFDDQRLFIAYAAILQLVLRSAQQALDSRGGAR